MVARTVNPFGEPFAGSNPAPTTILIFNELNLNKSAKSQSPYLDQCKDQVKGRRRVGAFIKVLEEIGRCVLLSIGPRSELPALLIIINWLIFHRFDKEQDLAAYR